MIKNFFAFLVLCLCYQDVFAQNLTKDLISEEQRQKLDKLIVFPIHSVPQSLRRRLTEKQNTNTVHHHMMQASLHKTPRMVDLKLHNIPVLDQGNNDACTFFATVTAINATLQSIHDLSPMCLIQLDKYINPNPTDIRVNNVLTLIQQYGIVPLNTQKEIGCAGVYDFDPKQEISVPMSPDEYQNKSEIFYKKQVSWRYLFDDFSGLINPGGRLPRIKEALIAGKYVVLEYVLLPNLGIAGATGTHVIQNDTWVENDSLEEHMLDQILTSTVFGHAIVIIGYDDDATAMDSNGKIHHGLLKLRNSWGSEKGDHGDFYMTYDYMRDYGLSGIQFCLNQDEKNSACW